MIWWSICGCSKETTPSFIFYLNFIYLDFKLLFVCMNNNFNNLYESGGCISGSIGAAAGMPFKKNWAESTTKWAALGFWGAVWGARLGKRCPHTEFSAPPNGLKIACAGRRL
jgi:hypothetical protein